MKNIGLEIKELLKKKNITIVSLSEKTGLSTVGIGNILREKTSPTVETLEKIANALDVPMSYFFVENENKTTSTDEALNAQLNESVGDIITSSRLILNALQILKNNVTEPNQIINVFNKFILSYDLLLIAYNNERKYIIEKEKLDSLSIYELEYCFKKWILSTDDISFLDFIKKTDKKV